MPTAMPDLDVDLEQLLQESTLSDLPYNVILHNDEVNTFDYVIVVLIKVFTYPVSRAQELAERTHHEGRALVWSGAREQATSYTRTLLAHGLTATCEKSA